MKQSVLTLAMLCVLIAGCGQNTPATNTPPTATPATNAAPYQPVDTFDPGRDPDDDLAAAIAEAQRSGKRILLDIGGDWCVWCTIMDDYYAQKPEIKQFRDDHYINLKINYSTENENAAFLETFPAIAGYPHLFVLDSDGSVLHSQNTGDLEQGRSYNDKKFMAFLQRWAK
jgi:thiol:disulfide interchange protein